MTCEEIHSQLFAFQFGEVDLDTRTATERHLSGCQSCLSQYLAIKREVETAAAEKPASADARRRIRDSVVRELGVHAPKPPWRWWERPVAAALAACAVAASIALVHSAASMPGSLPRSREVSAPKTVR